MVIDRGSASKWMLAAALVIAAAGLGGCGESETEQRWTDLQHIHMDREDLLQAGGPGGYRDTAAALDFMLRRSPDLPENFRNAIEALSELERRLADGSADEEDRAKAEEYWSHLTERELPPEFR